MGSSECCKQSHCEGEVNRKENKKTINLDIYTTVKTQEAFVVTREKLIARNHNKILDDYEMDV